MLGFLLGNGRGRGKCCCKINEVRGYQLQKEVECNINKNTCCEIKTNALEQQVYYLTNQLNDCKLKETVQAAVYAINGHTTCVGNGVAACVNANTDHGFCDEKMYIKSVVDPNGPIKVNVCEPCRPLKFETTCCDEVRLSGGRGGRGKSE